MTVSDRHYAAQVRGAAAGERTRLYTFDDLGCAVVWLDRQAWKGDPRTEIWVKDWQSGEWLDARLASYVEGRVTPMDYGMGAQREASPGSVDFARARQLVLAKDAHKQMHGDGHRHPGAAE